MPDISAHTIIQCLTAIAQHHGLPSDPIRLIKDYGLSTKEPDSALLLRIAADIGLSAKAASLSWKDLLTLQDRFPILIRLDNGKGMIVVDVRTTGAGKVAILDPLERQAKIRWLDRQLFCRRWHGDVVFLQPLPAPGNHHQLLTAIQLQQQGQLDQAAQLFRDVLAREPHHPAALYSLAVIALNDGNPGDALPMIELGLRAKADFPPLWLAHGAALQALGRKEEALRSYDEALRIQPDYSEALINSGVLLRDLLRHREAIERFNRVLAIDPTSTAALANTAILLTEFKQSEPAIAMFERLIALNPNYDYALGLLSYERLHICDWRDFERLSQEITDGIRTGRRTCKTLAFMALSDAAEEHFKAAKIFAAGYCPRKPVSLWQGEHYHHDRIRIAYVSPDLREHPVGHLMAGIFEHHDKSRFETIAISLGIDDHSRLRERMLKAFDHFIDAGLLGSQQIAEKMREMEVDIAIDLAGYTSDSRIEVFAYRPAPVQVGYLGYPGTSGTDYIDYLIADRHVIPEEHRAFYTEQVVHLPDTYLPTDASLVLAEQTPTRADCGLPETGLVFCSFSHDYKISPLVFSVWMRLLDQVPGSVLWLMSRGDAAQRNLRREAQQRGIDPLRLVFASRIPRIEDHLARYRQADLFLDTHPYNAHTTAADALMAGLPVITYMGGAFPARVAGSLLHAIGMPELITHSLDDYEALALGLATHPERLADLKRRLLANRATQPLFNTANFCRHLEALYIRMRQTADGQAVAQVATKARLIEDSDARGDRCRLCHGEVTFRFKKRVLGRIDVSYFECQTCRSLQTEKPYWLAEAYSEQAERFDTGKASRTLDNFYALPSLFKLLALDERAVFIDWGGGSGLLTRLLRDLGFNYFCFDRYSTSEFSQGFLWQGQHHNVTLISAFEVVEHFPDPAKDWDALFQNKPKYLICSTTSYEGQSDEWFYLSPENGQHVFFYSQYALALIASRFGYSVYQLGPYYLFCKQALNAASSALLADWVSRRQENQIQTFSGWLSQPFLFAARDHALLSEKLNACPDNKTIVVDMVFFQLNFSGIARLWETVLRLWATTEFGKRLLLLDRAHSAPRIDGLSYRDIPAYDYLKTAEDCETLEQICRDHQATLFLSTYYSRPIATPSLLMIYDMIPELLGFDLTSPMWREKHLAIQAAERFVCISQNTANDLSRICNIDASRITVAHCGVASTFIPATPREIESFKSKYGIVHPYFLLVGERGSYKNAGLLFSALHRLPEFTRYHIVCLGGRPQMEPEFQPLTADLNIIMLRASNDEMNSAYSGALALIYPSMYEGFGLPVLEAMACACPVITCRGGAIPEIAGEDVLYVATQNPEEMATALQLVQEGGRRERLIQAGLSRVAQYSWQRMADILRGDVEGFVGKDDRR